MKRLVVVLVIYISVSTVFCGAQADQIYVPDPAHGIATIQDGINAASSGDEVIVDAGTYGAIDFNGKAITVRSTSGPASTVIQGSATVSAVTFSSAEGNGSVLQGFTITKSAPLTGGSGIRTTGASPTIEENVIENNSDFDIGGGIRSESGSPIIRYNTIRSNSVVGFGAGGHMQMGGGIYLTDSGSAQVYDNFIEANYGSCGLGFCLNGYGAGIYVSGGSPRIIGNVISGNAVSGSMHEKFGGGIYVSGTVDAIIANNTVYHNTAATGNDPLSGQKWGGAGVFLGNNNTSLLFANNIVQANNGEGVLCGQGATPTIETNDLYSNPDGDYVDCPAGTGDLFVDPGVVDPANGDYHLSPASPLLDAGASGIAGTPPDDVYRKIRLADSNGNGIAEIDIGADEFSDCIDNDGDGYGHPASPFCSHPELDCDDTNAQVNPGVPENCTNSIDDNCNGLIDGDDPACQYHGWSAATSAEAAVYGTDTPNTVRLFAYLAIFLVPAGMIFMLRTSHKKCK